MAKDFIFNIGDLVQLITPDPALNGKQGTVVGCHGVTEDIPRLQDAVVAMVPWPELMYTVQLYGKDPMDEPVLTQESWLTGR